MVNAISEAKAIVPSVSGADIFGFLTWLILFLVFLAGVGVTVFLIIRRLRFNKKIVIFEKIGNQFEPVFKDRAIEVRAGAGGDMAFYLRKKKKYLPVPRMQTGKRTFWYWIREDGEWINFTPGDFDEQHREMGARFLDTEMRHTRVSLQTTFGKRYDKPKWLEKYGAALFGVVSFMVIGIILWLIAREIVTMISQLEPLLESQKELVEMMKQLLGGIDAVGGGSGFG